MASKTNVMEAVVDRLVVDSNVAFSEDFTYDRTLIVNQNNGALPENAKIIFTQPLNQEITFEEKTAKSCEKDQEKSPETTTNQKVGTSRTGKQNLSSEEKLEIIAEAKLTSNRQSYSVPSTIKLFVRSFVRLFVCLCKVINTDYHINTLA